MKNLLIIQWGEKRSVLENVNTKEIFIVDNDYLMNLDEMGLIL